MNTGAWQASVLAAEPPDPELERRYRDRLRRITERRLTGPERAGHALGLLLAVATAIQLLLGHHGDLRPIAWVARAAGLSFCIGWAVVEIAVLRSGVDRALTFGAARAQLVIAFAVVFAALMLWAGVTARDTAAAVRFGLVGLVYWCVAGLPTLISHLGRQAELRIRSDVLRLELMIAEAGTREVQP